GGPPAPPGRRPRGGRRPPVRARVRGARLGAARGLRRRLRVGPLGPAGPERVLGGLALVGRTPRRVRPRSHRARSGSRRPPRAQPTVLGGHWPPPPPAR